MILDTENKIHAELQEHLNKKSIEELKAYFNELNKKIQMTEQKIDALSSDLSALLKIKKAIKHTIVLKEEEHMDKSLFAIKDNEDARKKLYAYLDSITQCPFCPMKFTGTPSEREKAKEEHIHEAHPGKKYK